MGATREAGTDYPSGAPNFKLLFPRFNGVCVVLSALLNRIETSVFCSYHYFLWVSHVMQELLTLPEHLSSPPVLIGVCVPQSLVFCVMFYRSLFVLSSFFY
jgi:hypothetical protein